MDCGYLSVVSAVQLFYNCLFSALITGEKHGDKTLPPKEFNFGWNIFSVTRRSRSYFVTEWSFADLTYVTLVSEDTDDNDEEDEKDEKDEKDEVQSSWNSQRSEKKW